MINIFIEGVCGTGKTTLINTLGQCLPAFVIPELPEFARGLLLPFSNSNYIQCNFFDYIRYEITRETLLKNLPPKVNYAVVDRSYLSIIALTLSMKDFVSTENISAILEQIIENLEKGRFIAPNHAIVLNADYNTIVSRNKAKDKKLNGIWVDLKRILAQQYFYNYLIQNSSIQMLQSDMEPDLLVSQSKEIICECEQITREEFVNVLYKFRQNLAYHLDSIACI